MSNTKHKLPKPILNEKEIAELDLLKKRFERLTKQNKISGVGKKAGNKAKEIVPAPVKAELL